MIVLYSVFSVITQVIIEIRTPGSVKDYAISCFIIWLQQYARSDWLVSGQDFLVMTGIRKNFLGSTALLSCE